MLKSQELVPRWGVSPWRKWYVRIIRYFINLREQYKYRRAFNQYLRNIKYWEKTSLYFTWLSNITFTANRNNGVEDK